MRPANLLEYKANGKKPLLALVAMYAYESLGVRYVASALRQAGFDCLELYFDDFRSNQFKYPSAGDIAPFIDLLREKKVDIVGLSVRSPYRKVSAMVTERIRTDLGIPVIWGSSHATIVPEDAITVADAICRGEGEAPVVELMQKLTAGEDISGITGMWYRKPDGTVIRNPMGQYAPLEGLGAPAFDGAGKYFSKHHAWHAGDPWKHEGTYPIMASRGCPHYCTYCTNTFFLQAQPKYLRLRTVDSVIAEITNARKAMPAIKRVKFYDDMFGTNKKWLDEFVEKYPSAVGLPFDALLSPQNVTATIVQKLKAAGATIIEMGIQTGSERVAADVYDRRYGTERLIRSAHILHESGVRVNYGVITDNPLETPADRRESLETLLQLPRPYVLFVMSLTHFPGTPLTERLLKEGHITPDDVEGPNDKCLYHWEASFSYARPPEVQFYLALMALLAKDFVPKGFIRWLMDRKIFMRYPQPLVALAWCANIFKLAWLAARMYREGSLTFQILRRHMNLRHLTVK